MSVLDRVVADLRDVEAALQDRPALARRVHDIAQLLAADETRWIGTTRARRLLGVRSENTVKAWARLGLLRSRRELNGRIKVNLEDVLRQRAIDADLEGTGDNQELSPAEHRIMDAPLSPEECDRLDRELERLGVPPMPRHDTPGPAQ
jgi:hypothetical protein